MRETRYVSRDTSKKERVELLFKKMQNKFRNKEYFTLSNVTHDNMMGFKFVDELKPIFKTFIEKGLIKETDKYGRYCFNDSVVKEESDEELFISSYRNDLEKEIKKHKKFIITTAVMGKKVNTSFLASIKNYAKRNKALLLLLPCEDVASRGRNAKPIELDDSLKDCRVVFKDTYLNKNLCLCAIKTSAKQINPLSGLDRLTTAKNASIIVASPKTFLKYVPNMHYDIPFALMTTGAITENNYDTDKYMSKRTAYLAENDHTYGAIIVETEHDDIFHFRHVKASIGGSFIDLGIEYFPNGSIKEVEGNALVVGDSHVGYHDEELHKQVMKLAFDTSVQEVVLHDIFHGSSISHHDVGKGITNAIKAREGKLGLRKECIAVKNYLTAITNQGLNVSIVKSNHDSHLLRFLEEGRYVSDPMNYEFSLKLALAATKGEDPLQFAIEHELGYKNDKVKWLEEDSGYKVFGVECSMHGAIGANGCKGSSTVFEKGLGNCVTAHTHSASIIRDAYCVGTVGLMDMKYNKGLSSWTRTCCLIYSNGTKQLVNFIPDSRGNYSYRA